MTRETSDLHDPRPDTDQAEGLVEPEGVNAQGDVHDDGGSASGEERSGGAPGRAGQAADPSTELLGPPAQDGAEPGQELSAGEG